MKAFLLFRTLFFYDKGTIKFFNVFDPRTLLPSNYFWFYKFTSENVRRII